MWKTGTRIEKELSCTINLQAWGPVFRWPAKTYDLVRMRRTSDRQMKKVLSLANSKEKCSNPNMKSFPCLTSDFFYQNKICPKFSEFYLSEIQSSLMVLPPKQNRFLVFCWLLDGKADSAKLGVELCESCDLGWRYAPRSFVDPSHENRLPKNNCHGDTLKITLFFQWEIHRLHSWLGNFHSLFCKFCRGVRPLTLVVWVIWNFLALCYGNYSPLNRIQILHQEFHGISLGWIPKLRAT